jgi:hypothetical protein
LRRDLASYALAAGAAGVSALALTVPADAQIVYTPTFVVVNRGQKKTIDFNNDGIADAVVYEIPSHVDLGIPSNAVKASAYIPLGGIQTYFGFLGALGFGGKIGDSAQFVRKGIMENVSLGGFLYTGGWEYYYDHARYLGVRFGISGAVHYGWVRIKTKTQYYKGNVRVEISGYAYETEPNRGIRAGDTGENGAEFEPSSEVMPPGDPSLNKLTLGALALGAAR